MELSSVKGGGGECSQREDGEGKRYHLYLPHALVPAVMKAEWVPELVWV